MIVGFGISDPKLGKDATFLRLPKFSMTSAIIIMIIIYELRSRIRQLEPRATIC